MSSDTKLNELSVTSLKPLDKDGQQNTGPDALNPVDIDALQLEAAAPNSESPEDVNTEVKDEPPNGGLFAWMQVLGSFMIFFNSWGKFNLNK